MLPQCDTFVGQGGILHGSSGASPPTPPNPPSAVTAGCSVRYSGRGPGSKPGGGDPQLP